MLVYSNLKMQEQVPKTYGDAVMSFPVDEFSTLECKVLGTILDCTGKERTVWIVPARFFCMHFYLP